MNDTLIKVTETINNLEKTKLIISNLINKGTKDYYSIGEQVVRSRATLELSVTEKKEFVSATLVRIFPGNFGKIFVSCYKPFLNITIDNNKKKEAWLKLVEVLDDLDELDETNPFIKGMNSIDINKINCHAKETENNILNLLSGDITLREKYKKNITSMIKSINENEALRKNIKESFINAKSMLNSIGEVDNNNFDIYLEILNEDYRRYREIGKDIYKEASNEMGLNLSWEEFVENL